MSRVTGHMSLVICEGAEPSSFFSSSIKFAGVVQCNACHLSPWPLRLSLPLDSFFCCPATLEKLRGNSAAFCQPKVWGDFSGGNWAILNAKNLTCREVRRQPHCPQTRSLWKWVIGQHSYTMYFFPFLFLLTSLPSPLSTFLTSSSFQLPYFLLLPSSLTAVQLVYNPSSQFFLPARTLLSVEAEPPEWPHSCYSNRQLFSPPS